MRINHIKCDICGKQEPMNAKSIRGGFLFSAPERWTTICTKARPEADMCPACQIRVAAVIAKEVAL